MRTPARAPLEPLRPAGTSTVWHSPAATAVAASCNAPTGEGNQPTKAYAAAFVLLVIVLLLNACVEIVSRRARATAWNP